EEIVQRLRDLAEKKRIPSANAAVREALENYLTGLEQEEFRREMETAARDPLFLQDLKATQELYRTADAETASMIPEW
ncbi:MAG: hypothetical protein ACYC0Q_14135, partial [Eubacteriales bacterium]